MISNVRLTRLTATLVIAAIVVGIVILFIYKSVAADVKIVKSRNVDVTKAPQTCDVNYNIDLDVSELPCCVDVNGNITDMKYLSEYDLVVSNSPKPYLGVCSQFCKNGVSEDQQTCIDIGVDVDQQKFKKCIDLTKPIDCVGDVKPIAYQGIVRYYAYSATDSLCQNTSVCQN